MLTTEALTAAIHRREIAKREERNATAHWYALLGEYLDTPPEGRPMPVSELAEKAGVSVSAFYVWRYHEKQRQARKEKA